MARIARRERVHDGFWILHVDHVGHTARVAWARVRVRAEKSCLFCGAELLQSGFAYAPTHGVLRPMRSCVGCVEGGDSLS